MKSKHASRGISKMNKSKIVNKYIRCAIELANIRNVDYTQSRRECGVLFHTAGATVNLYTDRLHSLRE